MVEFASVDLAKYADNYYSFKFALEKCWVTRSIS